MSWSERAPFLAAIGDLFAIPLGSMAAFYVFGLFLPVAC